MTSLIRFIWSLSHEYGLINELAKLYEIVVWIDIHQYLRLMFFKPIQINLPEIKDDVPLQENVFLIDNGTIAYVHMISDDGSNYNPKRPYDPYDINKFTEILEKREKEIVDFLLRQDDVPCEKVLSLTILNGIGRDFCFANSLDLPETRMLSIIPEEVSTPQAKAWGILTYEERGLPFSPPDAHSAGCCHPPVGLLVG